MRCVLLLLVACAHADVVIESHVTDDEERAVVVLLGATEIAGRSVGDGGDPSSLMKPLAVIMESPRADHLLARIVESPNDASAIIALAALHARDTPLAKQLVFDHRRRFENAKRTVVTVEGCLGHGATVAEMLDEIDGGDMARRFCLPDVARCLRR